MNDDLQETSPEGEPPETGAAAPVPPQPVGLKFAIALCLVGLLVLLVLVFNIPGIRASAGISITRANWTLQSYADTSGILAPVLPGTQVTAMFGSDGRISGSAGCNRYNASYTVRNYAISISPPVSTKIFCSDPYLMQQETAYLDILTRAAQLRIGESNLNLYDGSGKPVLVFVKGQEY